ncbi:MAG: hypothetical protein ACXV6K_09655 [Halobacteriota archaeon]
MRQAFNGVIYDTDTATLIARNELPDTITYLKGHRNRYLYRTPDGAHFLYLLTESYFGVGPDPDPEVIPLTVEQALAAYKDLEDHVVEGNVAFPDIDFSEIREDTSDNAGLSAGARFGEEWNA